MNLASKVPNGILDSWNGVMKFINRRIAPSIMWSGGVISTVSSLFKSKDEDSDSTSLADRYGRSEEYGKEVDELMGSYYFQEDTTAGNEDAKLCLKKEGTGCWGVCEDYEEYVRSLVQKESERRPDEPKLDIRVYYAESDMLIGKMGQEYFERCWQQVDLAGSISYRSKELPGTNHDSTVLDFNKGAAKEIFDEIAASR